MTTNAFRHRPPEQCTLSKEDQQHILRISNNDQELLDELMAILRQLRPLPPRGASVRHTTGDVTEARCAGVKAIVGVRPPDCRTGPKCGPAKPGAERSTGIAPTSHWAQLIYRIAFVSTAAWACRHGCREDAALQELVANSHRLLASVRVAIMDQARGG
jgi:hypothetical protein